jgi:hypothetical protein
MEESFARRLDLRAPLEYVRAPDSDPFTPAGTPGDRLFCFALDPVQCRSIEPDRGLLGGLIFAGQDSSSAARGEPSAARELPAGNYLFIQRRESLGREACIDLAIEQQKDGLWERLRLADCLYVRFLFEDGGPVTQLFRGCRE